MWYSVLIIKIDIIPVCPLSHRNRSVIEMTTRLERKFVYIFFSDHIVALNTFHYFTDILNTMPDSVTLQETEHQTELCKCYEQNRRNIIIIG